MPHAPDTDYTRAMKSQPLSKTNPHLRDAPRAQRDRARAIASSTAIETGEAAAVIERRILEGRRPARRVELA
jgi:hypothetical protein